MLWILNTKSIDIKILIQKTSFERYIPKPLYRRIGDRHTETVSLRVKLDKELTEVQNVVSEILESRKLDKLFRPTKHKALFLKFLSAETSEENRIKIFIVLASSLEGHKLISKKYKNILELSRKYLYLKIPGFTLPAVSLFFLTYAGQYWLNTGGTKFIEELAEQLGKWGPKLLLTIFITLRDYPNGHKLLAHKPLTVKLLQNKPSYTRHNDLIKYIYYPNLRNLLLQSDKVRSLFEIEDWFTTNTLGGIVKPNFIFCAEAPQGRIILKKVFEQLTYEKRIELTTTKFNFNYLIWLFIFEEGRQLLDKLSSIVMEKHIGLHAKIPMKNS